MVTSYSLLEVSLYNLSLDDMTSRDGHKSRIHTAVGQECTVEHIYGNHGDSG